jgi:hypothetical protein
LHNKFSKGKAELEAIPEAEAPEAEVLRMEAEALHFKRFCITASKYHSSP